ncbi:MAG: DNA primase [Planctomycetota bacterium]|nr:DNA primase [Planctomycetota bacterium]
MPEGIPAIDELERIRDANPIEDVVQGYVELSRRGNVFKGLCPFHADKNPSMDVNPERRTFRCWACEEHGDVFTFIQKIEGVEFPEAKKILADRAGIEIKEWKRNPQQKQQEDAEFLLLERVAAWYQKQLQSDAGTVAREYLTRRGFSELTIRKFRIGFAPPGWNNLLDELRSPGSGAAQVQELAENLGLLKRNREGDGYYDAYRDRVIFPILEHRRGKVVGFGGRHLGSAPTSSGEEPAKYINSRESTIFSKKKLLYGYREGRNEIRLHRKVILCEGYTDVMMAHQSGFPMAVASLGTALTREHVALLARRVDHVDLLFDGDEAGQRAAIRSCELFLGTDVGVRVVILSQGQDPCDLLASEQGGQRFEQLLQSGEDPVEFIVKQILIEHPGNDSAVARRRIGEISRRVLDRFEGIALETAAGAVARVLGHTELSILRDHQRLRSERQGPATQRRPGYPVVEAGAQNRTPGAREDSAKASTGSDLIATEDAILVTMLRDPEQISLLLRICPPERWSHPVRRALAIRFQQLEAAPDPLHIQEDREKSYYLRLQERQLRENDWMSVDDRREVKFDLSIQLLVRWLENLRNQIPQQPGSLEDIVKINQAIQKLTEEPDSFRNPSLLSQIINTFEGMGNVLHP